MTAGLAALITGLQTTFNPGAKATRLDACGIDWSEFRAQVHESLLFEVPCIRDAPGARGLYRGHNGRWFALVRKTYLLQEPRQSVESPTPCAGSTPG